ncbi:hypothetical protein SNOG_02914 [Parastagonospora nodorum SN15]|uniref:Secreted protein n=1 Tax=Phaeosphaeria nodorum (strain SN15 / ATCC MYA-4574 / FGSC 10173) TaxID=321614 RepID=Q0UZA0_PHANO|nr:hypothetical protein SNOG_02914 [Parastagonospora nodorum SN15]EAT89645.1 hypothetical protein SNOG_02914 [Parastagonospora nodorum SN15]
MFILLTSFLFLFTTSAKNPNWDATVSMKAAAMGSVFRDCYLRTDEIDSLCITTVMTHTARQEACTVTVDCVGDRGLREGRDSSDGDADA